MSSSPTLKFEDYLKGLRSFYGILAGLCAALPLGNFITSWALFPPLRESVQSYAIVGTVILSVMMILAVYFAKDCFLSGKGARFFVLLACGLITAGGVYWHVLQRARYVLYLDDPKDPKKIVAVSIGNARSSDPNMEKAYKDKDDIQMLHNYGVTDQDIDKLYTRESVDRCRMFLYLSFLLPSFAFVTFASFGVLYTALDEVEQKAGAPSPPP